MRRVAMGMLMVAFLLLLFRTSAQAGSREEATLAASHAVLVEFSNLQVQQIPQALLADAHGIAIIPHVIKVGFVAGGRFGRGVVLVRGENGQWSMPTLIDLTGGSFGWQIGAQSTDVVLVFKSKRGVENLLTGKFTVGADAAVAAGPIGRQAQAATDPQLKAEILSYSRSRGLFAGVSIDGAVLRVDQNANQSYYPVDPQTGEKQIPQSALKLVGTVAHLTGAADVEVVEEPEQPAQPQPMPQPGPEPGPMPRPMPEDVPAPQVNSEFSRRKLAMSGRRLSAMLDIRWQEFLALPLGVYEGNPPAIEELNFVLGKYETVARDARYRSLADRMEFRDVYAALKTYTAERNAELNAKVLLPPPPTDGASARRRPGE